METTLLTTFHLLETVLLSWNQVSSFIRETSHRDFDPISLPLKSNSGDQDISTQIISLNHFYRYVFGYCLPEFSSNNGYLPSVPLVDLFDIFIIIIWIDLFELVPITCDVNICFLFLQKFNPNKLILSNLIWLP